MSKPLLKAFVSLTVNHSDTHGKGLFAAEPIAEGTILGYLNGETTLDDGIYTLWLNDHLGFRVCCDFKYINHRRPPNVAYYDDLSIVALADMEAGDELFHDYGDEFVATLD